MLIQKSDQIKCCVGQKKKSASVVLIAAGFLLAGMSGPVLAAAGKPGHQHDKGHDHEAMKKKDHGHHKGEHDQHQGHHMDHGKMPGGSPGKASEVDRKIELVAKDIGFDLKSIKVKNGETVEFVIRNIGALVHEFTIGPVTMQKAHQAEMLKMMESGKLEADRIVDNSGHTHPNTVLIEPKATKRIIWTFAKAGDLEFGCNIPGHYEAGMKGKFTFTGG